MKPIVRSGAPKKSIEQLGINIMVRLVPADVAKLDQRGKLDGMTRSATIRAAIHEYLSPNKDAKLLTSWAENSIENTADSIRSGMSAIEASESIFDSLLAVREFKKLHPDTLEGLEESLHQALQDWPVEMELEAITKAIKLKERRKGTLAFVMEQAKEAFGEE